MSVERVLDPTPAQLPARPPPATRSVREERSLVLFLGLLAAALFLLFQQGTIANSDGQAVFDVTRSLVEDHDLTIDEELGSQGRGGSHFSHFGIGLSVVGVVPYVAAYPVARLAGHDYFVYEFAASSTMPLICALLVVLLYLLARRLGASIRPALLVAGGSVAGTYVLAYTKEYYSEPLAAAFLVLAIERTLAKAPRQACVALVLAFLCRPEVVAVTPVFLLAFWYDGGFRSLRKAVPVVAAGGGLVLVYNAVRFGGPLDVGYGTETFTSWHFGRLGAFFVNPSKSVLLFAPVAVLLPLALLALWRVNRTAAGLMAGNAVVLLVVALTWEGGGSAWPWGPRHLLLAIVPALPAIALWITSPARRAAALALFAAGFLVSASTLLVPTQAQQLDRPAPRAPHVIRQIELVPRTVRYTADHLYEPGEATLGEHRRYLSLWQVGAARELGRLGLVLAGIGTLLLFVLATFSLLGLRARLRNLAP